MPQQEKRTSSSSLLIDFEATGKDNTQDRITEIGAMLVDTDSLEIQGTFSQLVWDKSYPKLTAEVEQITGITQHELSTQGTPLPAAMDSMYEVFADRWEDIEFIVAYNADYDSGLYRAEAVRNVLTNHVTHAKLSGQWLCAMKDIESNYKYRSWKLAHIALDKMVAVDPKDLHRAINDVILMHKMLQASPESLRDVHEFKTTPWVYLQAQVPKPWVDGGVGVAEAKKLGFSWERAAGDDRVFEKTWVKRVKEKDVAGQIDGASFRVVRITY